MITAVAALVATSPAATTTSVMTVATVVCRILAEFLAAPAGLGAVVTPLVGLHASADRFARDAGTYLDIGLLNTHACGDRATAAAAERRCEHPLAIGFRKFADGDDADPALVVATVARAKTDAPTSLNTINISRTIVSKVGGGGITAYP